MASNNLLVHLKHCFSPPSLRSYLAEFISTFLFVLTAVGSAISARTSSFNFPAFRFSSMHMSSLDIIVMDGFSDL